jgi:hypothetical protein
VLFFIANCVAHQRAHPAAQRAEAALAGQFEPAAKSNRADAVDRISTLICSPLLLSQLQRCCHLSIGAAAILSGRSCRWRRYFGDTSRPRPSGHAWHWAACTAQRHGRGSINRGACSCTACVCGGGGGHQMGREHIKRQASSMDPMPGPRPQGAPPATTRTPYKATVELNYFARVARDKGKSGEVLAAVDRSVRNPS